MQKRASCVHALVPWSQFIIVSLVFASFFLFVFESEADIIYVDENGDIISSEKTGFDGNGNVVTVPPEEIKEEIVTPSGGAEEEIVTSSNGLDEEIIYAGGEHLDLDYGGISVISDGDAQKVIFHRAPPNAVNLVIPDGVTEIERGAFGKCKQLESVVIPNSVNRIPPSSFINCSTLKSASIPVHATVCECAFMNCAALESVTITKGGETIAPPEDYGWIASQAFSSCRNLKVFEFPVGIHRIEGEAFAGCMSLESVSIPEGIGIIEEGAFHGCVGLKSVTIPGSVGWICENAFEGCRELTELVIPEGVEMIGYRAFHGCRQLERVSLPDSLLTVGFQAFWSCPKLEHVALPKNIVRFANAFDLSDTSLALPPGNTRYKFTPEGALIDEENQVFVSMPLAFEGHYTIPDGIRSIGPQAFRSCRKLSGVTIPSSVTSIGEGAFSYSALREIEIPPSVTEFQAGKPMWGVTQRTRDGLVTNPVRWAAQAAGLFVGCSLLERVTLPENMKKIPVAMFKQCSSLEEIRIPDSVKEIEECAFLNCEGLKRITLPPDLRILRNRVFCACGNLEEVNLPDGLEYIEWQALALCPKLKEIKIPKSVAGIEGDAFEKSGCEESLRELIESLPVSYEDE